MNSQVKEMWVNALRSGDYNQATGKLRTPEGFCCLGVLTDLYAKEKNKEWIFKDESQTTLPSFEYYTFEQSHDFLPMSVQIWAGLESNCPLVMIKNEDFQEEYGDDEYILQELSELNDDNLPFCKIADLIESQL